MIKKRSEVAVKVEQDHHAINQQMGELKKSMMGEVRSADFSDWKLEFVWQLRDFKNRLLKHFDLEEEGGFMTDVLEAAPQSEMKVTQLKREHEYIITSLDRLTSDLKEIQEMEPTRLEGVRNGINDIMKSLRDHETEEHMLMQRAYFREFGGAD
ncbi:hypothetical protein MJD09_15870 [bacterium]|nr:hypothetical protein [bacterium]